MAIWLRSPDEIERMAHSGRVLWGILCAAAARALPGVTTGHLDRFIQEQIRAAGAEAVMLGYRGQHGQAPPFGGASAICINEEVVHAPPGARILREGDIATIDCALRLGGWCADAAVSVVVGKAASERAHVVAAARRVLEATTSTMRPGIWWSQVAREAQRAAALEGLGLVREFAGHGIGHDLHERPMTAFAAGEAPSPGRVREGAGGRGQDQPGGLDFVLRPGMTFTVEPVLVPDGATMVGLDDGWTMVTADRSPAAHEERTVAITRTGARVLTG